MLINNILVVDKRELSKIIFETNYYSNYNFKSFISTSSIEEFEILNSELIFVFVYEASDLVDVIPLYNRNSSLIIIYSDPTLLFDNLEYACSINISEDLEQTRKEIESIIDFIEIQKD
jgi:hypothetical protein